MAMKDLDNIMLAIFSRTPEKLENAIVLDGIEGDIDVYRDVLRKVYLFELLSVAGDVVVFEYITSSKSSDSLYIMHSGYNHSNRIRKWLLETDYISDYERVTDQAFQDKIFNESRG